MFRNLNITKLLDCIVFNMKKMIILDLRNALNMQCTCRIFKYIYKVICMERKSKRKKQ